MAGERLSSLRRGAGALFRLPDFERLDHHAAEREEVGLARRGRPPGEPDAALWLRLDETQQLHPLVATSTSIATSGSSVTP